MYKQKIDRGSVAAVILAGALAAGGSGAADASGDAVKPSTDKSTAVSRDLASTVQISISAQSLASALISFSAQTDMQVVTVGADVRNLKTTGVTGRMTVREALQKLLNGSGLQFKLMGENTVGLVRETPTVTATSEVADEAVRSIAEYMLLAQVDNAAASDAKPPEKKSSRGAGGDVEEMIVQEGRIKPFSDANVDLPRTINDQQPYYVFDAKTIERSGAITVEDFLKTHLTMNTVGLTNGQQTNLLGNTSSINLRGLGANKTLVLVNGRRVANVTLQSIDAQPDLNGIPLSAIDRIEVLPSSASGIYGGSAIGGVVNVILKKDYSGGELRLGYSNAWNTDAPNRRISATFGQAVEGGKTHLMFTGQWSDSTPLLFGDRRELLDRGLQVVLRNSPNTFYSTTNPFLGAGPNITSASYTDPLTGIRTPDPGTLSLKDGRALGSRNTTIPLGTPVGASISTLSNLLLANAGRWNLDLPLSTQSPTGLLRQLGSAPVNKAMMATVRRQMADRVEAFLELSFQSNHSDSLNNANGNVVVPASAPTNPFNSPVRVRFPSADDAPLMTDATAQSVIAGLNVRLPSGWIGQLDYNWSKSRLEYLYYNADTEGMNIDIANGSLNPFVDTVLYPLNFVKYRIPATYDGATTLTSLAVRGSGPLPPLPWGAPSLTAGIEHRILNIPENVEQQESPITILNSYRYTYFARKQITDSGYLEIELPLVAKGGLPLLRALDLQFSGRAERYTVDAGTPTMFENYKNPAQRPSYGSPTLNGQPFKATASYLARNFTVGLKYQPLESVTLRASVATAFLPPTPSQLVPNPTRTAIQVTDPRTLLPVSGVSLISGGNPDLKPQGSKGWNAGLIWQPLWSALRGIRFDLEYYQTDQVDQIGSLGAQAIVDAEKTYPARVTRDAGGQIVAVDTSLLNLYKLQTEGWDLSVDHRIVTRLGDFNLHLAQTYIQHEQRQLTLALPLLDYAGYVGDGGPAKLKANLGLNWERHGWMAGWTTYYFGAYKQYGAAGGPNSLQFAQGGVYGTTITVQGSSSIPAQIYHDLFFGYSFGGNGSGKTSKPVMFGARFLDGMALQVGVKNILNTIPPFDANYSSSYYISPYGDKRLRNYWISASKQF